jgi:very-short-patch-repair endonuclease
MRRIHPEIRRRARELRQPQTPAEQSLWKVLQNRQLVGFKFHRQHPVGGFIADFFCARAGLVVEVDGDSHAGREEYDSRRTAWLESQGYP